jgi:hypothetical protein
VRPHRLTARRRAGARVVRAPGAVHRPEEVRHRADEAVHPEAPARAPGTAAARQPGRTPDELPPMPPLGHGRA